MKVGMLTAPFRNEPLEDVFAFAEEASIPCLELIAEPGSKHVDLDTFDKARAHDIKSALDDRGLEITSLSYYDPGLTDAKKTKAFQANAKKAIDAAALLDVDIVCMLAGFAAPGKSKLETIDTILPKIYQPILTHARKKKIKIALENWYMTCLQGLDTFDAMFDAIPDENFGLNYDPSHLYHQQCDHLLPVSHYKERIFHVHAKDTLVDQSMLRYTGNQGGGWWRYVIPGFGNINWGEFVSHLRMSGYDYVLSIEHEDATQTREEGFIRGAWYLEQFC